MCIGSHLHCRHGSYVQCQRSGEWKAHLQAHRGHLSTVLVSFAAGQCHSSFESQIAKSMGEIICNLNGYIIPLSTIEKPEGRKMNPRSFSIHVTTNI